MKQFKKAKVIMLPNTVTNGSYKSGLYLDSNNKLHSYNVINGGRAQHLYIISDDEIKEGDWKYNYKMNCITQHNREGKNLPDDLLKAATWCKKIIVTTDTSLTIDTEIFGKDRYKPLLQPSQQFIKKYIKSYNKGKIITDVSVEYEIDTIKMHNGYTNFEVLPYFPNSKLSINPDITITIKPIKENWNREEVIQLLWKAYTKDIPPMKMDAINKVLIPEFKQWIDLTL